MLTGQYVVEFRDKVIIDFLPYSALYRRSFVADGNFKADHLNQRNAEDDVHLTDGEAFMTRQAEYSEHLKEAVALAPRYSQVSCCLDSIAAPISLPK